MAKLGLALSGGGFRATLFHVGVIRCLRDAGLLSQVTHIASVSGGSIIAAHLALNWSQYTGTEEEFDAAAEKILDFVQLDVRNRLTRRYAALFPLRLLMRGILRRPGRRYSLTGLLEDLYAKHLYGERCVHELPESPTLHILATNVGEGFLSSFHRDGLLMQRRSESEIVVDALPGRLARISMAVAASSAFPGFFPPIEIGAAEIGVRAGEFSSHTFTDGGVYDNLGVRAFTWLYHGDDALDDVFVSDAGQPFRIRRGGSIGFVANAMRASDVLWDRVGQLERQNFDSDPRFQFISIVEEVSAAQDPTAVHSILQPEIQNVRTDLDRFSQLEISALVTHGYAVARQAIRARGEREGTSVPEGPAWDPFATRAGAEDSGSKCSRSPLAEVEGVNERARELQRSAGRRIWGSLLDFRDPMSLLFVPVLALVFVVLPVTAYRLYDAARTNEMVVQAIAHGDPEFQQILALFTEDPKGDWEPTPLVEQETVLETDYDGFEVLADTRIVDLRRWTPEDPTVYSLRRIRLRKEESYSGDGFIRFNHTVPILEGFTARLAPEVFDPIARVTGKELAEHSKSAFGAEARLWQTEFDLSSLQPGESTDLTIEGFYTLAHKEMGSRVSFSPAYPVGVASTWLLFPDHKPYRSYDLLRYEPGRVGQPRLVEPRFVIDHPHGSIIAWSITNAKVGHIYECQWEWDL